MTKKQTSKAILEMLPISTLRVFFLASNNLPQAWPIVFLGNGQRSNEPMKFWVRTSSSSANGGSREGQSRNRAALVRPTHFNLALQIRISEAQAQRKIRIWFARRNKSGWL